MSVLKHKDPFVNAFLDKLPNSGVEGGRVRRPQFDSEHEHFRRNIFVTDRKQIWELDSVDQTRNRAGGAEFTFCHCFCHLASWWL